MTRHEWNEAPHQVHCKKCNPNTFTICTVVEDYLNLNTKFEALVDSRGTISRLGLSLCNKLDKLWRSEVKDMFDAGYSVPEIETIINRSIPWISFEMRRFGRISNAIKVANGEEPKTWDYDV